jgi:serine/threonine protein kinase
MYVSSIFIEFVWKFVEKIFRSLLLGVYTLHFEGIIHRDIKPGNIFAGMEERHFALGFVRLFRNIFY